MMRMSRKTGSPAREGWERPRGGAKEGAPCARRDGWVRWSRPNGDTAAGSKRPRHPPAPHADPAAPARRFGARIHEFRTSRHAIAGLDA